MSDPAVSVELDEQDAQPTPSSEGSGLVDLALAGAIALAAPIAAIYHPDNTVLRLGSTVPALLLVPGYLLLQAILPSVSARPGRGHQAALSIGLSLPVVGLAALSAAVTPWGFRPVPVMVSVTLASLGLCALALYRRTRAEPASEDPDGPAEDPFGGSA